VAITITYATILPLIPLLPTQVIATADGEPSPAQASSMLAVIAKGEA
jgi:hypothetical protein